MMDGRFKNDPMSGEEKDPSRQIQPVVFRVLLRSASVVFPRTTAAIGNRVLVVARGQGIADTRLRAESARSGHTARFPIAVVGRKCWRARSASAASAARGDMLPNRDIRRRIIDDLMDRCCSQINELHGTRSVYVARMRSDAGCYIGRDATNCSVLIVVRCAPRKGSVNTQ